MNKWVSLLAASGLVGCSSAQVESTDKVESMAIGDVQKIERRGDGLYDVTCRDGRVEVANESEILANTLCTTPNPFPAAQTYISETVPYAVYIGTSSYLPVTVSNRPGTTTKAKVQFSISATAPERVLVRLYNERSGRYYDVLGSLGSAEATHEVNVTVANEPFEGTWYLYVANGSPYYDATVNSWSLTF